MARQAQQKRRQAINKYNQQVRQHNQKVKQAVNKYNQAVRSYNSRVRANRAKIISEFDKLKSQKVTVKYTVYQQSVTTLHTYYSNLDSRFGDQAPNDMYNWFLDLSERETANSLAVSNQLYDDDQEQAVQVEELHDAELKDQLKEIDPELHDRWLGALFSLNENNPDASRHFCTSAREIFTSIFKKEAPNQVVLEKFPGCSTTQDGHPTRKVKVRYLLANKGIAEAAFEDFIDADVENIIQLFGIFNDGTHGSAGKYPMNQLSAIKKRVQDGLFFLTELVLT